MADFTSGKNWSDFYSGILPPASTPQPAAVDWNQFYSGILPSAPSAPPVSPNLTAAEKQLLQQQLQQSQTLQAGYNPNGTAKIRPSWTIPADAPVMTPNATPASWNSIDQAGYNAAKKPGTWLASSRMNAQALMRQMAQRGTVPATVPRAVAIPPAVVATPNANVTAPIKPQSRGGLFELIFGPSKNGMGGLAGLLGGPGAGGIVGMLGAPSTPRAPRTARAPDTYTPATSVSGNTGYRNERTGVLHTSDKGHQYGSTSSGQRTDYGASPGQKTAGLKPGDRVYDSSTNSWGLK